MAQIKAAYLERELMRGQPANAFRFVRPDWRRFVKPGSDAWLLYELYERKFNSDQPRVPAGSSEGGQWTGDGGAASVSDGGPETQIATRISPSRRAECELQYRKDTFICNAIGTRSCWVKPRSGLANA